MSKPPVIPYETLFDLWRSWIVQSQWPPLDKWLKQQRRPSGVPSAKPVGVYFFSAMRYLQLACAMEASYQQQSLLNWSEWDKTWSLAQIKAMPVSSFWFWVMLREHPDSPAPRSIRDADARRAWFATLEAHFAITEQPEEILLWAGLRPQWLPLLEARKTTSAWSHEQLTEFIHLQNSQPPLWLRYKPAVDVETLAQQLTDEGVQVTRTAEGHLFASGGTYLSDTTAYQQGVVEIQDLASQMIAQAVDVKPGQKVWDACAGAGGKSLAIAARMNNKGALVATDLHEYKLDELKRRSKRAGIFNIRTFIWSGDAPLRLPKEIAQQQGFDWVLVDAPCTSAGTWRRNPDARWRFTPEDTESLLSLQQRLLSYAAHAVRPQGFLVYATCSWQVSENETQVQHFLNANPEFTVVRQQQLGAPVLDSDTMFVAVLQKSV